MAYGATPAGFVLKPMPVILAELATAQRATIDPLWNTDSDGLAGQLNGIVGDHLSQLWEVLQDTAVMLSRESDGQALDNIGALAGTARDGATKSSVLLTCNINAGVTVPAGSVVSRAGNTSIRVVTTTPLTNTDIVPASLTVIAEAESAGAITALPHTMVTIETQVDGWNSVDNGAALGGGTELELDPAYRARQIQELARPGGCTIDGIRIDVLDVTGVTAALVSENTSAVAAGGLPPKSFEVVVTGGLAADLGAAIWRVKPAGIEAFGTTTVSVNDSQGIAHNVKFSRPISRALFMAVELVLDPRVDAEAVKLAVKNALAAAAVDKAGAGFLGIGSDVYAGRMVCTAIETPGVLNARVGLSFTAIAAVSAGVDILALSPREVAVVLTANIAVVTV